jgi:hypothetical protein
LISDATNLKSTFPTKTATADQFANLLSLFTSINLIYCRNFFSSNAGATTQGCRGMIITTFDVLKKRLADLELYKFTTAHDLCTSTNSNHLLI